MTNLPAKHLDKKNEIVAQACVMQFLAGSAAVAVYAVCVVWPDLEWHAIGCGLGYCFLLSGLLGLLSRKIEGAANLLISGLLLLFALAWILSIFGISYALIMLSIIIYLAGIWLSPISCKRHSMHWLAALCIGLLQSAIANPVGRNFLGAEQAWKTNFWLDVPFQISVTASLLDFNTTSTMLHGISGFSYHSISHFVIGTMARGANLPIFDAYDVIFFIFFIPLFWVALTVATECVKPIESMKDYWLRSAMLTVVVAELYGISYNGKFALVGLKDIHWMSESMLVSLILLLLCTTAAINKSRYWIFYSIFSAMLCVLCKVSMIPFVGLVALAIMWEQWNYIRIWTPAKQYSLIVVLLALSITSIFYINKFRNSGLNIELFDYIKKYGGLNDGLSNIKYLAILTQFFVLHFFSAWLALMLLFLLPKNVHSKKSAQLILIGFLFASMLACIFIKLPIMTVVYFTMPSVFFGAVFFVGLCSAAWEEAVSKKIKIVLCLIFGMGLIGLFVNDIQYHSSKWRGLSKNIQKQKAENLPLKPYITYLNKIRHSGDKNCAVYIPKKETEFWSEESYYKVRAMLIPAISERPALYGLPINAEEEYGDTFGFSVYSANTKLLSKQCIIADEVLKKEAANLNLEGIYIIESSGGGLRLRSLKRDHESRHE